jgi:anthranilate phosphoribosyltransferase
MSGMKEKLSAILQGHLLDESAAAEALTEILSETIAPVQTAAFLTAVQMRGIALSELKGFHQVLKDSGTTVDLREENLIDVCGTGGDGKGTFNISTLTAFVLAGAGIKVAKHGNSSATSGSGSSDILARLGVEFTADAERLRNDLDKANICYLHAPLFQPVLKRVAAVRKEIGFRTFFNLLGPLINPARPRFQFIGVADPSVLRLYRYFLEDSETRFTLVHSRDGYDEISLTGSFDAVTNNGAETYYPEDLGFETVDPEHLRTGKNVEEAAADFTGILQNNEAVNKGRAEVVVANAAFAMRSMEPELSFAECRKRAEVSLRSGAAFRSFELLRGQ